MSEHKQGDNQPIHMDSELSNAFAVLELPITATKEDVEKRYSMLLKKIKNNQGDDLSAINQAYKLILSSHLSRNAQMFEEKLYAGSKTRKAIDEFWHKYKAHVWISVLIIVIIAVAANTILDKRAERIALSKLPPSNLDIMFVGNYQQPEQDDLGVPLLEHFPEWQRIKTFLSYNPDNPKDQFDIAATQKNMINLITEIPDIYITDSFNFELLVNQGAFKRLEPWEAELPADRLQKRQGQEDDQIYLYGVDTSDSPVWDSLQLYGNKEMFISMRFDTEKPEESLLFIKRLLGIE